MINYKKYPYFMLCSKDVDIDNLQEVARHTFVAEEDDLEVSDVIFVFGNHPEFEIGIDTSGDLVCLFARPVEGSNGKYLATVIDFSFTRIIDILNEIVFLVPTIAYKKRLSRAREVVVNKETFMDTPKVIRVTIELDEDTTNPTKAQGACYFIRVERIKSVAPDFGIDDPTYNGAYWEEIDSCSEIGDESVQAHFTEICKDYPDAKIVAQGEFGYMVKG